MRYRCPYCDYVFDADEMGTRVEHEEFWGAPCAIEYNVCPSCGEDISDDDIIREEDEDEEE